VLAQAVLQLDSATAVRTYLETHANH
jgi:hypothetical protein